MATMQRLREEDDTVLRGSEYEEDTDFRRRTLRSCTVDEEKGIFEDDDREEPSLRQNAIILPQELIDMVLGYLFDNDPHAQPSVRLDSNFQTPIALRLCHWTREKYIARYYNRTTFILPAHKTHTSFFEYFHRLPYERTWCYIYEWGEDEDGCEVSISREKRSHPRHRRYLCKWFRREPNGFLRENEQWIGRLRTVRQFYRRRAKDYEVWRRSLEPTNPGMQSVTSTVCLILLCLAVLILMIRESWRALSILESTAGLSVRTQGGLTNL